MVKVRLAMIINLRLFSPNIVSPLLIFSRRPDFSAVVSLAVLLHHEMARALERSITL